MCVRPDVSLSNQNSTDITAWVLVPEYTKRKEISVQVTPTRLTVKLSWHGRVLDGPLRRRCKAGESCWILEEDTHEVQIMLPKDDAQFWRSLFEGGDDFGAVYKCLSDWQKLPHSPVMTQ